MKCVFPTCDREAVAKGLCRAHHKQQWRGQELREIGIIPGGVKPRPPEERFWEKVNKNNENGCPWIWTGARTNRGHGNFGVSSKKGQEHYTAPHRFIYELVNGPIPDGFDIDHECHNEAAILGLCNGGPTCLHRICVYPEHLVAKTRRDNLLASPLTIPSRMVAGEITIARDTMGNVKGWLRA